MNHNLDLKRPSVDLGEEQDANLFTDKSNAIFSGFIAQELSAKVEVPEKELAEMKGK